MFILKILSFIIVYVIKQRLFKQKVRIQHIVYILILTLWTKPVLQQSLERQELAPFLDKILDYIMMLFIVFI
ncbi:hypothetical protein [Megaira polyxenophila phage MAnkyphage_25.80]|nr:hypothetical protein [Megaira polyxenophila phage MAnkyphage_25.80]